MFFSTAQAVVILRLDVDLASIALTLLCLTAPILEQPQSNSLQHRRAFVPVIARISILLLPLYAVGWDVNH
jgi:hypothetical protein